jgi:ELWxxDGT repeat protein
MSNESYFGHRVAAGLALGLLALVLVPGAVAAADSDPYLVKNIRSGSSSSNPTDLAAIGNRVFFTATDGGHGREPWVSDGTALGTHMIKNISPGSYSSNARDYTLVGSQVFFTAQDGNGRELFVTDGTAAGTRRVKDIRPGGKASAPAGLTALGTTLFFSANDGPHGRELWKSDGTEAGTVMINDLEPGKLGSNPVELTAFANRVYFVRNVYAPNGSHVPCCLLMRSDGTEAGTRTVIDKDGGAILDTYDLTRSGSLLYFAATADDWPSSHLWRTDGTKQGTRRISGNIYPEQLTNVGGTLFFTTVNEEDYSLWKSTGTAAGTTFVTHTNRPSSLTGVGSTLFFLQLEESGWQYLMRSDGTAAGTFWLYGANTNYGAVMGNLTDVNGVLMYTLAGYLWQQGGGLDGSPVVPYADGNTSSWGDRHLTDVDGTLFYVGIGANGKYGYELWAYTP